MKKSLTGILVCGVLLTTVLGASSQSVDANVKTLNAGITNTINNSESLSTTEKNLVPPITNIIVNEVYNFAFDRDTKFPLNPGEADGPYIEEFKEGNKWLNEIPKEQLSLPFTDNDGVEKNLNGYYIKNAQSNKTIIFAHGYRMNALQVGGWVKMYYDMGYNILVPDARAHGQSEGTAISFGWKEKTDYKNWANKLVEMNNNVQIIISGVSMGGATTMMSSGEEMPSNVKGYIEDCGYNSAYSQFGYLKPAAKEIINMALEEKFPGLGIQADDTEVDDIMKRVDTRLQKEQGFSLEEASSTNQLQKNTKPMLFIHGGEDNFVPTSMVYKNYEATQGEKELWVVPNAGHGMSIVQDRPGYQKHVEDFLNKIIE